MNHCVTNPMIVALHFAKTQITITRLYNILKFFMAVKNNNFQMKNCDFFLILAQNID